MLDPRSGSPRHRSLADANEGRQNNHEQGGSLHDRAPRLASQRPGRCDETMGGGMVERHGSRPGRTLIQPAFTIRGNAGGMEPGGLFFCEQSGTSLRLTHVEAAALQSFPPDMVWPGNQGEKLLAIGNAVPPLTVAGILGALLAPGAVSATRRATSSRRWPNGRRPTLTETDINTLARLGVPRTSLDLPKEKTIMTNQKTDRSSLLSVAQCPDERHDAEEREAEPVDHAATVTGDENREGVRQLTSTSSTSLSLPNVAGRDENDRPECGLGNHAEKGQPANGEENAPVHGDVRGHHQDGYRNHGPRSQDEEDHNQRIEHSERDPKPSHGHRKSGVNVEPTSNQIDCVRDRSHCEADNPDSDDQSGHVTDLHAASVCVVRVMPSQLRVPVDSRQHR